MSGDETRPGDNRAGTKLRRAGNEPPEETGRAKHGEGDAGEMSTGKAYAIIRNSSGDGNRPERWILFGARGISTGQRRMSWLNRRGAEDGAEYILRTEPGLKRGELRIVEGEPNGDGAAHCVIVSSGTGGLVTGRRYLRFDAAGVSRVSRENGTLLADRDSADLARGHANSLAELGYIVREDELLRTVRVRGRSAEEKTAEGEGSPDR